MPYAVVNGVKLYYETCGAGEPIVFIHGIGVTSRVWEFQKEAISKHFRMIVYDLRGSGKSSKTPCVKHSAELLSKDLKALLDYLKIDSVHIVGLSLGAAVGMKFAVEYPDRVKTLVLSGAFADLRGLLSLVSKYFSRIIGTMLMLKCFGELAAKVMLPSAPRKELLYYHSNIIKIDEDEVEKYGQILSSYSITAALNKVRVPTLILYGEYEYIMHTYGKLIQQNIKNSRMEIIPGVGHGWNGEQPELFNKKILEFINANHND